MPAGHPSASRYRNQRLCHVAGKGVLITVKCPFCRRIARFWADDLIKVLGPDHQLHLPPFPCSRCKTIDLDVRWTIPPPGDLSGLTVRRPVSQVVRWIWRDEKA